MGQEPEIEEEDEPPYENQELLEDAADSEAEADINQINGLDNEQGDGNRLRHHDMSRIEHVRTAQEFIAEISRATYHNSKLDESTIDRRSPRKSF